MVQQVVTQVSQHMNYDMALIKLAKPLKCSHIAGEAIDVFSTVIRYDNGNMFVGRDVRARLYTQQNVP